jgi:hypothetical protein
VAEVKFWQKNNAASASEIDESSDTLTDSHDITEILLKVVLDTIKPTNLSFYVNKVHVLHSYDSSEKRM